MALSNEDKKDVASSMGKALANKVSKVTRDNPYRKISDYTGDTGKSYNETPGFKSLKAGPDGERKPYYKSITRHLNNRKRKEGGDVFPLSAKSKALSKKSEGGISLERQKAHTDMQDKGIAKHWMKKLLNE